MDDIDNLQTFGALAQTLSDGVLSCAEKIKKPKAFQPEGEMFDTSLAQSSSMQTGKSKLYTKLKKEFGTRFGSLNELNPLARLAHARVKLYKNEKRLSKIQKDSAIRSKELTRQWNNLEDKEQELQNNFIAFDKFVKENMEKRARATDQMKKAKAMSLNTEKKIQYIKGQNEILVRVQEQMQKVILQRSIFQEYLTRVLDLDQERFETINGIISAYQEQRRVNSLLQEKYENVTCAYSQAVINMNKFMDEKYLVVMGMNNYFAQLEERYEMGNIKCLKYEALVAEVKNQIVNKIREFHEVTYSISNIYNHMGFTREFPKLLNAKDQIEYIQRTLTELSTLNKIIKAKLGLRD